MAKSSEIITNFSAFRSEAVIEAVKTINPPKYQLISEFWKNPIDRVGTVAKWEEITPNGPVDSGNFVNPDDAARSRSKMGRVKKAAEYVKYFFEKTLEQSFVNEINSLLNFQEVAKAEKYAADVITQEIADLKEQGYYAIELLLAEILSTGALSISESTPTVTQSVDFSVPANHKVTVTGTNWSDAAHDIIGDIIAAKTRVYKSSNKYPTKAICNSTVADYISGNTAVQAKYGEALKSALLNNKGYIGEIEGITFMRNDAVKNSSEDLYFDNNTVVFYTDSSIITPLQGSENVPVSPASESLTTVLGEFAYLRINDNPGGLKLYLGNNFLPALRKVNEIYILDITI